MRSAFLLIALHASLAFASPLNPPRHVSRSDSGVQIPIQRRVADTFRRRDATGAIGLGDYLDVTYNVLLTVGETLVPLVLDTGSSDLWVLSDACTTDCFSTDVPKYPTASFQPAGIAVQLLYGDSRTGTHADGPIGRDAASILNFSLVDQYFAAISSTNASVLRTGSAGIFGLGFPLNRCANLVSFAGVTQRVEDCMTAPSPIAI
ncbi:aspartic peptidase domain-containing protein [Amylostereum chailletii]|nr:aspartic peptidase domain-containing protein [Amylostereum chailletii]